MTVRQLLRAMDSRELSEWNAIFRIEAEEHKRAIQDAKASATAARGRRRR